MTPEVVQSWSTATSVALAVVLGLVIVGLSIKHMFAAVTAAVCAGLLIGLVFLTTPKWKEITLEVAGIKATIAQLEEEVGLLQHEKTALNNEISMVRALANLRASTAQDLVAKVGATRESVGWASFLPAAASYSVRVNASTIAAAENSAVGSKLTAEDKAILDRFSAQGFEVVAPASDFDLSRVRAQDVVIAPFAAGSEQK